MCPRAPGTGGMSAGGQRADLTMLKKNSNLMKWKNQKPETTVSDRENSFEIERNIIMSLYKNWTELVVNYVKTKGEKAFWADYSAVEERIYRNILARHDETVEFQIEAFAAEMDTTPEFIMGFLDGINESLNETLDVEALEADSQVQLKIDLEKLYFNMLDAKADYLYGLPQWDGIFSEEKRREIKKAFNASKTVRNEEKIGRNDPCPCGSGKKYKKCHGARGSEEAV